MNTIFKASDGKKVNVYCWDKTKTPKAVVQIFHGMAEHAGRYEEFANFLNSNGIVVYANDHRGHGKTSASEKELGYLGKDGFNRVVMDEIEISMYIKDKYPEIPLFIFAHSLGSFVAQDYITRLPNIEGVILCGSAAQVGFEFRLSKLIAYIQMKLIGEEAKSNLLHKLGFLWFNKRIPNAKSLLAWLSSDDEEVNKYIRDKHCGFVCTASFYYYLSNALIGMYNKNKLSKIDNTLPIFIISGEEDPVGKYGKRVVQLHDIYIKMGIKNVKLRLYKDMRHEILNERNRQIVFEDVLYWVENTLSLRGKTL